MSLIASVPYPDELQRGVTQTLSLTVYDDGTGATKTATSGTVSIYAGSRKVIDEATVSAGNPSTYSLAASSTSTESLAGDWLEVWSLVIDGATQVFSRPAFLVRRPYRHVLTQGDVTELHPELADRETAGTLDLDGTIQAADAVVRRDLIKLGNRPELVFDVWALLDAHRAKTLELIFRADAQSVGDGRYRELADYYAEQYREEWGRVSFTYDSDQDGVIDDTDARRGGQPVVMLTSRKRWWY
jgi:hypothetical protein